ncbi:MAG TPA: HAD family phosphatase [Phycisphaerae bacterium]|nr:HAD family phosphatase [Phycisphaerae bacterium]
MPPIGIIFDMDGVLVDSGAAHLESWQRLAREIGAGDIPDERFTAVFGRTSADIISAVLGPKTPDEIRRLDDRKEAIYRDLIRGHVPVMPGAHDAVRRLHSAGMRIAVGSSGPRENIELVCAEMGLHPYLSGIVTGRDVQRGKPDPQVFQLAAERMHLEPSRCIVIEDAPSGIEAAHRAGMSCIALTGSHPAERLDHADKVIESLSALTPDVVHAVKVPDNTHDR